jgi:AcrR family transcriptional regulator
MPDAAAKPETLRRAALLDAAIGVFARFGYRKTSMDEVARAAGVSRQGLYLYFATKDELFRATVSHALSGQLSAAVIALANESRPIEERVVAAFVEWAGRYVGALGPDTSDLSEASGILARSILSEFEERFEQALANAIEASPLASIYSSVDLSAAQLARTLNAAARGFKLSSASRQGFVDDITVTVQILCTRNRDME